MLGAAFGWIPAWKHTFYSVGRRLLGFLVVPVPQLLSREEARERMREAAAPFAGAIATHGAVPDIQSDGMKWWQRAALNLATKARCAIRGEPHSELADRDGELCDGFDGSRRDSER